MEGSAGAGEAVSDAAQPSSAGHAREDSVSPELLHTSADNVDAPPRLSGDTPSPTLGDADTQDGERGEEPAPPHESAAAVALALDTAKSIAHGALDVIPVGYRKRSERMLLSRARQVQLQAQCIFCVILRALITHSLTRPPTELATLVGTQDRPRQMPIHLSH
jgi:hypothetical protein